MGKTQKDEGKGMDEYQQTGNDDSFFMRDRWYDDAIAIVQFSLVNAIGKAFEAHKRQPRSSNLKTAIWKIG
jgi:hypothetical protein